MQLVTYRGFPRRLISLTTILVFVLFCTVDVAHASTITESNANGTYTVHGTTRTCIDPDTGFLVGYTLYSGFTWRTNDGVVHAFPIATLFNSSNGYAPDGGVLCGPDDISSDSGVATDGSGFSIVVGGYTSATIRDRNGNIVFSSGSPCFC